jgi:dUTP pyrophosphatase
MHLKIEIFFLYKPFYQMSNPRFFVKRLTETAVLPKRGSSQAAGYDLYADQAGTVPECQYLEQFAGRDCNNNGIIKRTGSYLVSTGIAVKIPIGYYGRVASRSGLAVKNGLEVGAGVIDSDYRGEVKVLLRNLGSQPFEFKSGDRIAQLIIEKIETPDVEEVTDLDVTDRGAGGFGSTGVSNSLINQINEESDRSLARLKPGDFLRLRMQAEAKSPVTNLTENVSNMTIDPKQKVLTFACINCKQALPQFPHDGQTHTVVCNICHTTNYLGFKPSN